MDNNCPVCGMPAWVGHDYCPRHVRYAGVTPIAYDVLKAWLRAQPILFCIEEADAPFKSAQGYTTVCRVTISDSQIQDEIFHIMELPQDRPFKATALDAPDYLHVGTGWYSYDD